MMLFQLRWGDINESIRNGGKSVMIYYKVQSWQSPGETEGNHSSQKSSQALKWVSPTYAYLFGNPHSEPVA